MSASLRLYRAGSRLLEPAAPLILKNRLKRGKERADRLQERLGQSSVARPEGDLIWMHGASVGECRLLLDVFQELRTLRPGLHAVITSQTLTAADMIAARGGPSVIHQMAPVDAPAFVQRFLDHWRPDLVVFAEGEIWPNMLGELAYRWIPAALVNARMTQKTLAGWRTRQAAARTLFSAFRFISAADQATAHGLGDILHRSISVVGNLKQAIAPPTPDPEAVAAFRMEIGPRPVVLAASTHAGEDEIALDAFTAIRRTHPKALLLIAPRHPDRGAAIAALGESRSWIVQRRTLDRHAPLPTVDVLVADTMGELPMWFALSDAIYLGGAHAENVGGHNAFEPVRLGRRVATGPHGFNFRETFRQLEDVGALVIGDSARELSEFWTRCLEEPAFARVEGTAIDVLFRSARAPLDATLSALVEMLAADRLHA